MLFSPQLLTPRRKAAVAAASGSGWGDHGTTISLSTTTISNDTATTSTGAFSTVRGTQIRGADKRYFEVKVLTAGSGFSIIGLMDAQTANGASMDNFQLQNSLQHYSANGTAKLNDTGIGGFTGVDIGSGWSLADNDVLAVAYDGPNGFHYLALNNVWFLSGDPTSGATGTGHVAAYGVNAPLNLYPAISLVSNGVYQLRTASFTYAPPSGYTAWG
jgi:hypothetical protein